MIAGKRDLAGAGGGGSCKGMACGFDIVDDNTGDNSKGMCRKIFKENDLSNERTRGDGEISCLKL